MASFAIAGIAKNESRYLAEWIAYHVIRGARWVRLYDNESTDNSLALIKELSKRFPVDVIEWPVMQNDFNSTQKLAYEHAASHFSGKVDFVAFIDVDEFIATDESAPISEIMDSFDSDVGAVACQQVLFGSSGHTIDNGDLVISRFTKSARPDHPGCLWFKTIVRPELFESMETVHSVNTRANYVLVNGLSLERAIDNPRMSTHICLHPMRINHYTLKSTEEFRNKQIRMTAALLPEDIRRMYTDTFRQFCERDKNINQVIEFSIDRYSIQVRDLLRDIMKSNAAM